MATDREQDIELGIERTENTRPQRAVLTINTRKASRGGLRSSASVCWVGDDFKTHAFSYGGGGDFSKELRVSDRSVKATQKAIDKQHAEVFTPEIIAALTETAKAYYAGVTA